MKTRSFIKNTNGILLIIFSFLYANFFQYNNFVLAESENQKKELINNQKSSNLQENFYLIGPGDILNIKIYAHEEFSGRYKVLSDGRVSLPLIGNINLTNLNLEESRRLLEEKFKTQLLSPELNISIETERPIKISVVGEVKRPGIYSLTKKEAINIDKGLSGNISGNATVLDAIQQAGGITPYANLKNVKLIRKINKNGEKKVTNLNLIEVIVNGDQEYNPTIFDGDTLKILKAEKMPDEIITLADSNLSPSEIKISVIGAVKNPGMIKIKTNSTILQAVLKAGGPLEWKSNRNNIELIRIERNGTIFREKFKLNTKRISSIKAKLSDGDIIFVNSNSLGKISVGLQAITEPISSIITGYSLYKIISD